MIQALKFGQRAIAMDFYQFWGASRAIAKSDVSNIYSDYERRKIMQWFYKHKKAVK